MLCPIPASSPNSIARTRYTPQMVQRLTQPTTRVLRLLLEAVDGRSYGLELIDGANVGPGTLYPMLTRLEGIGWLESSWEDIDPEVEGRPARRYYALTAHGRIEAVARLEGAVQEGREGLAEA